MKGGIRISFAAVLAALCTSVSHAQDVDEMKLISAAQDCRTGEVAELMMQGVDLDAVNSGGYTPLMMAAGNGCEAVVRLLLENGADAAIKHPSFGDAAAQAVMNRNHNIAALLQGSSGRRSSTAFPPTQAPALVAPKGAAANTGGPTHWPKLGEYKPGTEVLYSGTAGKTWREGTIKSIEPQYGYNLEGVTGSEDAFFVVGKAREPFWTGWFVGDWKISVPVAMGTVTDDQYVYRTVSGGMKLPPLRISADGTYSWRVQGTQGEQLINGRWEPNPEGPGVILKDAEKDADWLVYNNSRTGSGLGETVILSSECCTYYDGSRLQR